MNRTISQKKFAILGGDIILIIASLYLSPLLRFGITPDLHGFFGYADLFAILVYLTLFYIFDFYNIDDSFKSVGYFFRFLLALIIADLFIATLFYVFNIRPYTASILTINTVLIFLFCLLWRFVFSRLNRSYNHVSRVLIVGAGWAATDLYNILSCRQGFDVIGFLDDDVTKWGTKPSLYAPEVIGGTDLLHEMVSKRHVDQVIIAITHGMNRELHKRIMDVKVEGVSVYEMPTFCEKVLGKIPVEHVSERWFVYVPIYGVRKTIYNDKIKKMIDKLLSIIILLIFSPVLLLVAIAIRFDSEGSAFYVQRRIGLQGKPFNLVKFRTMKVGMDNHREFAGKKNDPRITRLGKFLRISRFDEIPQLWNVIKGDMSFIGPRALMEEEVNEFDKQIPFFWFRHSIRPGITGWAQVNYPHGVTVKDALAKLEYDLYYIKNLSPILDFIIFAKTVRTVLFGTGAR